MKRGIQRWSWLNLRRMSGVQERLQRRFTPAGQVLLAATFSAGLFSLDTRQTLSFQAFGLGAALLLIALVGALRRPGPIQITRTLPRHATVGEPCTYRIELTNHGQRTGSGLTVTEQLPDPRPDLDRFLSARVPDEAGVNPVDRLFGYPRWRWLVRSGRWTNAPVTADVPDLAPGASYRLPLNLTPTRRGVLRLEGLRIARKDPLGLCRAGTSVQQSGRLLVLPQRYPVESLRPPGRRRLQPGGVSLASSVGDSQEYIGLRDYRPGDSPRHIHWPAWARTGQPVVKEYQDEYFSRQALVLDTFSTPGCERAFEAAVSVAASFLEPLQTPDSLLDLMFVGDRAYTLTGGRGLLSAQALLEILACVEMNDKGEFAVLSRAVLTHAPHLSACVFVLLDWDAPRQKLVNETRALGLPVRILVLDETLPSPALDESAHLRRLHPAHLPEGLAAL